MSDTSTCTASRIKDAVKGEARIWRVILPLLIAYITIISPLAVTISNTSAFRNIAIEAENFFIEVTQ